MRRTLLVLLCLPLAWVLWAAVAMPPAAGVVSVTAPEADDPPTVRGAYHIHSRASDGTGSLQDIADAAARAGLTFVIVTDHGDALRRPSAPRYLAGVLCIEAVEISTTDGHYAALGLAPPPFPLGGEARDVVEDVARLGGFGIAAHPDSPKATLRWHAWDAPVDGVEWFNADSQWRDKPRWRLLPAILQYLIRPAETVVSLFDRPVEALAQWDRLTENRRVVGLAAADAHARMGLDRKADPYDEVLYVRLPSYESVFRAFSLHVELERSLTGDAGRDAGLLLDAIRGGRVYTVFEGVAGPGVLSFRASSGNQGARQGGWMTEGRIRFSANANLPPGGSLVLLRNGTEILRRDGGVLSYEDARSGAYRVEARLDGAPGRSVLPWIVSNPVYVGRGFAARAEPPGPPPAQASMTLPAGIWRIEKDDQSSGALTITEGKSGVRREFTFQLGQAHASPFVALVTDQTGPMHDATRIAFRASANRPLRLSVQARCVDGALPRRWQRSVYLDHTPREVTISFADMRMAGTGERVPLVREQIASLLFVFDTTNARPGDGGTVRIEALRTER